MLSPGDVGCLLAPSSSPNLIPELSQWELEISCLHRTTLGVTWRPARLCPWPGLDSLLPQCSSGMRPTKKEGSCSHPAPEPSLQAQKCCALVTQLHTRDIRTSRAFPITILSFQGHLPKCDVILISMHENLAQAEAGRFLLYMSTGTLALLSPPAWPTAP